MNEKTKLGLELPTDPRWVNMAEISLEEILTDHAFCEQKAATSCITLIQRYSEYDGLVQELSPIVSEEWSHFRMVLNEMDKRGMKLGKQRKDVYVNKLIEFQKSGVTRDEALVERLLTSALIEARSAERFRLLSLHISDETLRPWYHKLMVSEAGHYKLFLNLAKKYMSEDYVMNRWREYLAFEAELMQELKPRADRMH
jgi:tRNA-(ms[2]io[6]A)-hydroxylase